jgi:hypothetical protein
VRSQRSGASSGRWIAAAHTSLRPRLAKSDMLKGECVAHHTPLDQAGCTRSLDQSKRHSSPPWLSSFRISASLSACGRSSYPGIFCTVRGLPKRTGFPIDWHFGSFAIDSATHRLCRGCFVVKCKPISVSLSDSVRRTIMRVKYPLRGLRLRRCCRPQSPGQPHPWHVALRIAIRPSCPSWTYQRVRD